MVRLVSSFVANIFVRFYDIPLHRNVSGGVYI